VANKTIKRMTPAEHLAIALLRDFNVPHATKSQHDLARAYDVIFDHNWDTAEDQQDAVQIAQEWVGVKGENE
jgi:hypothetical protein